MKARRSHIFFQSAAAILVVGSLSSIPTSAFATQVGNAPVVSKATFLYNLFGELGYMPGPSGTSLYADAPTGSWQWTDVHGAIILGLLKPDSLTHFGVSDPLTLSQAATAITKFTNISLPPSRTALSWLQQKDVLPSGAPSTDLTLSADLQAMGVLSSKKASALSLDYIPASWKVSGMQAENLIEGVRVLEDSPWLQAQDTVAISREFTLTPAALKSPQAVSVFKTLDAQERAIYLVKRAPSAYGLNVSETIQSYLNGQKPQSLQLFTEGLNQFVNAGNSWKVVHQQIGTNPAAGLSFQSTMLQNVTLTKTGDQWNYQASMNLAQQPTLVAQLVQTYAQFSNLLLTAAQQTELEKLVAQSAKASTRYQLHLSNNGTPFVTMSQEDITISLPSADIPLTNEALRTQFEQGVKFMTFNYELTQDAQFAHNIVSAPKGLPK